MLQKEWKIEVRQKHSLAGILLFVLSSVFTCYLSLGTIESTQVWSALLWLTGVFSAFNAMQKTFQQEGEGTQLYLYTLAHPRAIILAKSLYNALLIAALNLVGLFFFLLFFGTSVFKDADHLQFILGLVLGSTGLGMLLTFISGMAFKSGAGTGLVAILGFPLILPLIMTIVRFSNIALEGLSWSANGLNLLVLLILNVTTLVLALVLFPYLWRD